MEVICYVCNKKTKDWRQNFNEIKSKHSGTSIKVFIEKLLNDFLSQRNLDDETNCICSMCLSLIYAYDWTCMKVIEQEKELRLILLTTEKNLDESNVKKECTIVDIDVIKNGRDVKPSVTKVETPVPVKQVEPVKRSKPIIVRVVKRVPFLKKNPQTQMTSNLPAVKTTESTGNGNGVRTVLPKGISIVKKELPGPSSEKSPKKLGPNVCNICDKKIVQDKTFEVILSDKFTTLQLLLTTCFFSQKVIVSAFLLILPF